MAPKKNAVPAADARASGVNAAFYKQLEEDMMTVFENPVFAGVAEADPLPIKKGAGDSSGVQAVFNLQEFRIAMGERGEYKAAMNLCNVNPFWSPMPNVPLRESSRCMLKDHYFQQPALYPGVLHIVISDTKTDPRMEDLRSISPEELRAALWRRIAERVEAGACSCLFG